MPSRPVDSSSPRDCGGCSCLCDDFVEGIECSLGTEWFARESPSSEGRIGDRPCSIAEALGEGARLIARARFPLVCGGTRGSIATLRAMVELAEQARGGLDPASADEGNWDRAVQAHGQATATWGEVRDRADLLFYWRFESGRSHPRHFARFSVDHPGSDTLERRQRYLVALDSTPNGAGDRADRKLSWPPACDPEVLHLLRGLVRGIPYAPADVVGRFGVSLDSLSELAGRLRTAGYAAIVCGPEISFGNRGREVAAQMLRLTRELNAHTRCVVLRESDEANAVGATQVFTWRTGYPGAISFAGGSPVFHPEQGTAARWIANRDVDALIVVEPGPRSVIPAWLDAAGDPTIPMLVVGGGNSGIWSRAAIAIPAAQPGLDHTIDMYRGDGVPLTLAPSKTRSGAPENLVHEAIPSADRILLSLIGNSGPTES